MISKFLQMGVINRRARLARAIAGVCVVLWVAGSISTLYGCLAPNGRCPIARSLSRTTRHTFLGPAHGIVTASEHNPLLTHGDHLLLRLGICSVIPPTR
jgi:hypothetical protein